MHTVVRVRTTTYIHVKYNSNTHVHVALQFRDGTLVHSTHIHTMYYAYHGVPLPLNYNNPFVDTVLDTLHFTLFFSVRSSYSTCSSLVVQSCHKLFNVIKLVLFFNFMNSTSAATAATTAVAGKRQSRTTMNIEWQCVTC